jgi:hypothetical protein
VFAVADAANRDPTLTKAEFEDLLARLLERHPGLTREEAVEALWDMGGVRAGRPRRVSGPMLVPHISDRQIEEALVECSGHRGKTAERLGIHRDTLFKRIRSKPHLREVVASFKQEVSDEAEGHLVKLALAGVPWAVRFWLVTQARDRGYSTRLTVQREKPDPDEKARREARKELLRGLTVEQMEVLALLAERQAKMIEPPEGDL